MDEKRHCSCLQEVVLIGCRTKKLNALPETERVVTWLDFLKITDAQISPRNLTFSENQWPKIQLHHQYQNTAIFLLMKLKSSTTHIIISVTNQAEHSQQTLKKPDKVLNRHFVSIVVDWLKTKQKEIYITWVNNMEYIYIYIPHAHLFLRTLFLHQLLSFGFQRWSLWSIEFSQNEMFFCVF